MSLDDAPVLYLSFASLHVLAGHLGASALYFRRFGRSPLAIYRPGTAGSHQRVTRLVSLASLAWATALVATALSPWLRQSLLGRSLVALPPTLGWVVAASGLVVMLVAQIAMGDVFRIGQDERDPPLTLREDGLHALSRNPIYVGSFGALAGMTLWHPSLLLAALLALVGLGIHGLVRAEERFLATRFGARFDRYRERTPRYLGWPRSAR